MIPNSTIMKTKITEKFSAFSISQSVWLETHRTTDIDEITDAELEKIYHSFFPKEPSLALQVISAKLKELMREKRSVILAIATRTGIKETDSWDKFNRFMLNSSVLKKSLNSHNIEELKALERQFRGIEANFQRSAEKVGNKAFHEKYKLPIPSKN